MYRNIQIIKFEKYLEGYEIIKDQKRERHGSVCTKRGSSSAGGNRRLLRANSSKESYKRGGDKNLQQYSDIQQVDSIVAGGDNFSCKHINQQVVKFESKRL